MILPGRCASQAFAHLALRGFYENGAVDGRRIRFAGAHDGPQDPVEFALKLIRPLSFEKAVMLVFFALRSMSGIAAITISQTHDWPCLVILPPAHGTPSLPAIR